MTAVLVVSCGEGRGPLRLGIRAGDAERPVARRAVETFGATHPGLDVDITAAAGRWLDVIPIDQADVASVISSGAALDLTPYLARVGVDLKAYDPEVLGMFRRGEAVYALPAGFSPLVLAFNKDLFDRDGIPYPSDEWTWDDFVAAAGQLTRDSDGDGAIDRWGAYLDPRPVAWLPWIWSGGGDVLCASGAAAGGCLDAPATLAALRWLAAWVGPSGIAPGTVAGTRPGPDDGLRLFVQGRVAMATADHAWVPLLRRAVAAGTLRVGFAAIPHRSGFASQTVLLAAGYAVPPSALRRKPSVELVAALTNPAAEELRENAGYDLPAMTRAVRELVASDTLGWDGVFVEAAAHARAPWGASVNRWPDAEAALSAMVQRIMQGEDPGRAAHATAHAIDRMIGNDR